MNCISLARLGSAEMLPSQKLMLADKTILQSVTHKLYGVGGDAEHFKGMLRARN